METEMTNWIDNVWPKFLDAGLSIVWAVILLIVGIKVINVARKLLKSALERSNIDTGVVQFLDAFVKFAAYAVLILALLGHFGVQTTSFITILGSAGVAIGLSLQGSLSNFAGGVLILLLKPFVVGDYIIEDTNGKEGTVKEIQIFYTKLSTIDNKTIVIPNGMLTNNSITNATAKDERQLDLRVGISYNADIKKAKSVIEKLLSEDASILKEEQMNVFVNDLADSAVVLGIRAWVKNEEYWATRWRLLEEIKVELDENGIEIPYPQVTVHMKEDK